MMNPIIGDAEIIQDGDLNRSLKFYCENIVEEFDEGFVKYFGERVPDASQKVCWEYSKLCQETYKEEYEEDIVAAEKRNARKKKSQKKKKKKKKTVKKEVDPEELTGEERIMDQISRLPITGPDFKRRHDDEDEDDHDADDVAEKVASDGKPEIINEALPDTILNEPIDDPVMKDPVLADSIAKDEL
uniref:DUF3456 domain-containing protein n=2 Tax=Lygus hesperus TaxID=30085 RepID=A0A0K8T321_LYGHE